MAHVYKYLQSIYKKNALQNETFRIGTLRDYRRIEIKNQAISDCEEGRYTITASGESIGDNYQNTIPGIYRDSTSTIVFAPGTKINSVLDSGHLYTFCVSKTFSRKIAADFEADACIEISNIEKLAELMTSSFGRSVNLLDIVPCVYIGRSFDHLEKPEVPAYALKDQKYISQAEVRIIWEPSDGHIPEPFVNSFPGINALMKEIKL